MRSPPKRAAARLPTARARSRIAPSTASSGIAIAREIVAVRSATRFQVDKLMMPMIGTGGFSSQGSGHAASDNQG
jgi:hypothetical protein